MESILRPILGFFGNLLPAVGISPEFLAMLDGAFSWLVGLIQGAGYFMPLKVFVVCLGVRFAVDNWSLVFGVGMRFITWLRG